MFEQQHITACKSYTGKDNTNYSHEFREQVVTSRITPTMLRASSKQFSVTKNYSFLKLARQMFLNASRI